jgi:ABC-2 type transport system permease protein
MATRYGLKQVVSSELIKLTTVRSTLWTLGITLVGTLGVSALSANSVTHHSADWYRNFDPTNQSLAGLALAALAIGVFGALAFTSEYGGSTIRPTLAAIPDRRLLLTGKVIVVGGISVVAGEVLSFLAFGIGQVIMSGGGAPSASLGEPGVLRAVVLSGLCIGLLGLIGLALGVVIRGTAGAVSTFVGLTFLLPVLLSRLPSRPARFTPIGILANSVGAVVRDPAQLAPLAGLLLVVGYCAAVVAIATVSIMSRDT